jgi:beta-mannosidase
MNMIRVWGGGIYEEDIFYELCDEMGLLVWQDFMFSCAMYPGDASFLENVELEAIENVKRLRTHPSMALWCGNNESWMFWQNWRKNANPDGGQPKLWSDSGDSLKIVDAYNDIFRRILPNAVQAYGADIPYWESSPMSKNGGFPSLTSGDTHYWGVWWGQEPFHAYRENIGRFMSEYGFQSFPELATVDSFTVEQDWDIYSDVMEAHQKSSIGNRTIANYMDRHFRTPKDFENYLYLSQLLQAEGVKIAMEAHRLRRPYNMGSLYWQLNDCWPGASWSGIDYYGNWKALHYYTRKAFAEVTISFEEDEHNITANIISDRPDEFRGTLLVELLDLNGKKIRSDEKKVRLKSYEGDDFWKESKKELLKKEKPDEVILRAKLLENSVPLAENHFLFVPHKEIDLPEPTIKFDLLKQEGGIGIQLKSNKTAFGVRLSTGDPAIKYSDNFFTLYPDETKTVTIQGNITLEALRERLVVHSVYDSYASE